MSRKILLNEPTLINIGRVMELSGGDRFYTNSNTTFKELTGGDGIYTRNDNDDAYPLDLFYQWKDIGPLFPMEFKGDVGIHYKGARDRSTPSLSAIKGKRIQCINDSDEEHMPSISTTKL